MMTAPLSLRRIPALVLVAALGAGAPHVHAAPPPVHEAVEVFESERARGLYDTGIAKFDAGDYEGALEDLNGSLELESHAKTLYAKAQSLNKLQRCREAVPIYNEVLVRLPDESPAASAVKDALVTCAEKLAADDGQPVPDLEPEPEPDPEPESEPEAAWYKDIPAPILLGLGVVGVGVGGAFLGRASGLDPEGASDYGAFEDERVQQRQLRIRGSVILGVGGVLVLGGIVRYALVARKLRKEDGVSAFVAPALGRRSAGLTVTGRF